MREIKFRAWDEHTKKMLTWSEIDSLDKDGFEFAIDILCGANGKIPLQYTGIKDKNGVEIYEGDICKTETSAFKEDDFKVGVVKFNNGAFVRKIIYSSGNYGYHDLFPKHCEVIGNIYDNHELLDEK